MTEEAKTEKPLPRKGALLDQAKPAEEKKNKRYRLKVLLGGPSGSGKTQSIITLPREEGKRILVLDFDGRAATLDGEEGIDVLTLFDQSPTSPKAWRAGEQVRKELWALVKKEAQGGEPFPYSAVVEDSLTMMGNVSMNDATTLDTEHLGLGGAPGQSHWLPQIKFLRDHINSMRMLPCHYILTCHMEPMQDDEAGTFKLFPKVTRSLKPEIPTWFNETYFCRRTETKKSGEGKKVVYYWVTAGTKKYDFFKSTLNNKGLYWKDPVVVNLSKEPAGFSLLLALRFGGVKQAETIEEEVEEREEEGKEEKKEKPTTEKGKK